MMRKPFTLPLIVAMVLLLASCGHKDPNQAKTGVPAPPTIPTPAQEEAKTVPPNAVGQPLPEITPENRKETKEEKKEEKRAEQAEQKDEQEILALSPDAKPLAVESGLASWYGAPYHNRRGSNGQIYDMNAMTAAHLTLPLGSIVRVTNLKTGHAAVVRITDRGPFVHGRILDLSLAAAKEVDVWQPGVAAVRVEVLKSPRPLEDGGRWAVQIGPFGDQDTAQGLVDLLARKYHTAKTLCFGSPVGDWWVRTRVLKDDRHRAEELAQETQTPEGSIFLVRLD